MHGTAIGLTLGYQGSLLGQKCGVGLLVEFHCKLSRDRMDLPGVIFVLVVHILQFYFC